MATSNQTPEWHPYIEAAHSLINSLGKFAMHPTQQSQLAMQIAQQMALDYANSVRPMSPLDPMNRPGMTPELRQELGAPQVQGPLTQTMGQ